MKYLVLKQSCLLFFLVAFACICTAEESAYQSLDPDGVKATREGNVLFLQVDEQTDQPITIPRMAASLRSMQWEGQEGDHGIALKPYPKVWEINWKQRPDGASRLRLEFDSPPLLLEEIKPKEASADGSFYLPAHFAHTFGEKIRYEPQPHKNTVGFWTGKEDAAAWALKVEKPGRFSVAILQGCGKGQGGSEAVMLFLGSEDKPAAQSLSYTVVETGHFQNFQWHSVGEVSFTKAGDFSLVVKPKEIKKAALMDIRAIHLIRLPESNR
jgi:hypothetical protein